MAPWQAGPAGQTQRATDNLPMKHPILLALLAGLLVLLVAFAMPLWQMVRGSGPVAGAPLSTNPASTPAAAAQGLPWQVQALPDGLAQVFGLVPGQDTLAQARARIGDGLQVALVARLGEVGVLEALAEPFAAGFVTGRLVLAFDVPAEVLARWRSRAPRSAPMDDGVRRFELLAADRDEALAVQLAGLSFVPSVRLTEADVRQRFAAPAQLLPAASPGGLVLLYPALGLAAAVGPASRGVLQYVAPRDFDRLLRAPLLAAPTSAKVPTAAPDLPPTTSLLPALAQ